LSGDYEGEKGGKGQNPTQLATERAPGEISSAPAITDGSRDKAGRFLKGQSGNRSGRPAVEGRVRQLAQRYSRKAVMTLVRLMDSTNPRVQVAAATALLDRALGKPPQAITGGALVNINMPAPGQPIRDVGEASRFYSAILGNPHVDLAGITFAAPDASGALLHATPIRESSSTECTSTLDKADESPPDPRVEPRADATLADFARLADGSGI